MNVVIVVVVRDNVHEIYWVINDVLLGLVDSFPVIWLLPLEAEVVMLEDVFFLILVEHEQQRHQLRVVV